ncbi:MAG: ATP-dependent protease ATPase subunit HslU [Carboxydocellales bacterium]
MLDLTPKEIVAELDKYIVGQTKAKKSVAIALRNRIRRKKLPKDMQDDVIPKNIIMIGPTGVGKTEIARRIARLVNAPFVKVEASKFTEIGYVGRDVESMVRDLVETAIRMVKNEKITEVEERAAKLAEEKILDHLLPMPNAESAIKNPFEMLFGGSGSGQDSETDHDYQKKLTNVHEERDRKHKLLQEGALENHYLEIEVEDNARPLVEVFTGSTEEMGINLQDMLGGMFPKRKKHRKVTVTEARKILTSEEAQKLIDMDEVVSLAVERAEQTGIIFLDEIDKIAAKESTGGPDVSRGGVQRDILPIVEGSTVMTKYGAVKTDHILFIAAGAFHIAKPSDLIPELQGRFPIRVELESLTEEDFRQILVEPQNALIKQYIALLASDGVKVTFSENALAEIAKIAYTVNEQTENIGARRLHTVLEKLLEDVSFEAPDNTEPVVEIDQSYVLDKLSTVVDNRDLSRYIL